MKINNIKEFNFDKYYIQFVSLLTSFISFLIIKNSFSDTNDSTRLINTPFFSFLFVQIGGGFFNCAAAFKINIIKNPKSKPSLSTILALLFLIFLSFIANSFFLLNCGILIALVIQYLIYQTKGKLAISLSLLLPLITLISFIIYKKYNNYYINLSWQAIYTLVILIYLTLILQISNISFSSLFENYFDILKNIINPEYLIITIISIIFSLTNLLIPIYFYNNTEISSYIIVDKIVFTFSNSLNSYFVFSGFIKYNNAIGMKRKNSYFLIVPFIVILALYALQIFKFHDFVINLNLSCFVVVIILTYYFNNQASIKLRLIQSNLDVFKFNNATSLFIPIIVFILFYFALYFVTGSFYVQLLAIISYWFITNSILSKYV
jgi:hypothetical protein